MSDISSSPWWVVVAGAFPSVASGAWVIWRWRAERHDRLSESTLTREERMARELETQRAALSKDQAELFDRLRVDLGRCQDRLRVVERDRDRGWELARYWNRCSHELRHAGLNAQAMVTVLCAREGIAAPSWPDMDVPAFEEPIRGDSI